MFSLFRFEISLSKEKKMRIVGSVCARSVVGRSAAKVLASHVSRSYSSVAMSCMQCEQTASPTMGCTTVGNCGKTATVSRLQDLLMHALKGIAQYTSRAAALGAKDSSIDAFSMDSAFATLTNVNFSDARFVELLQEADKKIVAARALYERACATAKQQPEKLAGPATWRLRHSEVSELVEDAKLEGDILDRRAKHGPDVVGMQEMILYGLSNESRSVVLLFLVLTSCFLFVFFLQRA